MINNLSSYLEFARETAYQAGKLTLEYFQKGLQPDTKIDGSPVTVADRRSEELIRSAIEKRFPQHAILGEEYGGSRNGTESSGASCRWIIDPIDGTQSFIHGVPLYSILIGLEIDGKVEAGVAYFPALNEMVSAGTGLGCWWNGRPAHVSSVSELKNALISFTDLGNFRKIYLDEPLLRLVDRTWYRAGWGDAYGYLLVATGRAEIQMDPVMEIWDCGPFPPIFKEAGGFFGDWNGEDTIYAGKSIATSMTLLPEVLSVIKTK